MTRALPFTETGLRRAIAAARKEGLRVRGIRPDGTLIVDDGDGSPTDADPHTDAPEAPSKWADVEV